MSPNVSYCKNCTYKFDMDEFDRCPSCDHQGSSSSNRGKTSNPQTTLISASSQVANLANLDDLVAAQNRTTHAVRSLALFLFMSIGAAIPGMFLFSNAMSAKATCGYYCSAADGMLIFSYFFLGLGFAVALFTGLVTLARSRVQ